MRDAITGLIGRYDQLGRYLDRDAIDAIATYLAESTARLAADRKSTRLNSSHEWISRMPSSA